MKEMPSNDPEVYKRPVQLNLDGIGALSVWSNLILALKHPANVGAKRSIALDLVEVIGGELVRLGVLSRGEIRDTMKRAHWDGHMDLVGRLQRVAAGTAPQVIVTSLDDLGG
jgi:hypothetical protein